MRKVSRRESAGLRDFLLASTLVFACLVSGVVISHASADSPRAPLPVQTPAKRSAAAVADTNRGAELFQRDCAHCHGKTGDGSSPVRATLHPQPLDLTNFQVSDAYIMQVLHNGVPGTDMPAWHASPEDDLRAEAQYTAHLARPDVLSEEDRYAPPEALAEAGKRVYEAHCARCHGTDGNGDGKDARRYSPKPPSFAGMRPSFQGARRVIESGIAGTAMPSWPLLTPPEIQAVTYYIQSFYNQGASKRSSAVTTGVRP